MPDSAGTKAVLAALRAVLYPLVKLAMGKGVRYAEVDELVRDVFVQVAREAHAGVPVQRSVSRISASTGINRREVTRLLQNGPATEARSRSPASEVFARWISDPAWQADGQPLKLPRLGAAPSFEALATSVNRDVRPRALLEELVRLGLARVTDDDHVALTDEHFVPSHDEGQMLAFLSANVGDHLHAAVDNVVSRGSVRHLEQALFADELSLDSIESLRPQANAQWKVLVKAMVPKVQQRLDEDKAGTQPRDQRLRIGMYMYNEPMVRPLPPEQATEDPADGDAPGESAQTDRS
ncbi:MAG: hypothetical protein RI907_2428 [Pseudomonadota bacterium]|jgi:hypothetical protein